MIAQIGALEAKVEHLLALHEGLYELKSDYVQACKLPEFSAAFKESNPLVTICVATNSRARLLLERCIPSLLRQSYRNLQIVVVGDHCTDETEYLLAKLRDTRISFENLPSRGPYPPPGDCRWFVAGTYALNRALELSEGAFITHSDDDDSFAPSRVERLLEEALLDRAEFLWHRFSAETRAGFWKVVGNGELRRGQVTTGSIFYHNYFKRIPWDINAYRLREPGDWNRIRKIKFLEPKLKFVGECLTTHFRENSQAQEVLQDGEKLLKF